MFHSGAKAHFDPQPVLQRSTVRWKRAGMCCGLAHSDSEKPPPASQVLADLQACLVDLDALGAGRAGAYLSMAIDVLCLDLGLAPDVRVVSA
ncbi:MAG: hypothetical protein ACTHKM_06575 [Tsuneonella sp.]